MHHRRSYITRWPWAKWLEYALVGVFVGAGSLGIFRCIQETRPSNPDRVEIVTATPAPPNCESASLMPLLNATPGPEREAAIDAGISSFLAVCPFQPVRLINFDINPDEFQASDSVAFLNGVCVAWPRELGVQIWIGAEEVTTDSLVVGETVPFIGTSDTPEGRARRTLQPGCTEQSTFLVEESEAWLPLVGKEWRLVAHIVVTGPGGEVQHVAQTSPPFRVLP